MIGQIECGVSCWERERERESSSQLSNNKLVALFFVSLAQTSMKAIKSRVKEYLLIAKCTY